MIGRIFITGLKTILPLVVTIAIIVWLLGLVEDVFGAFIRLFTGARYYIPGMGIVLCLVIVFLAGLLMRLYFGQVLTTWGEKRLQRIPFVKSLYNSMKDLVGFFDTTRINKGRVVMVKIGDARVLALVTREVFDTLPMGMGSENEVAVFIPMSYNIGGFTLMVQKSAIIPIEMPVQDAMRYAIMGGMVGQ